MEKISHRTYYLTFLIVFLGVILFSFFKNQGPEMDLVGTWKEISWEYEKSDPAPSVNMLRKEITHQEKLEISKDLVIHKSEIWKFKPKGLLTLIKSNNQEEELNWYLKGRGNVLKLSHQKDTSEHYHIHKLTNDTLEIHFYSDLQVRGIVKMKFERI